MNDKTQISLQWILSYAVRRKLISNKDRVYVSNRIMALIGIKRRVIQEDYLDKERPANIEEALCSLTDEAVNNGTLTIDTIGERDILSAQIMDCFTPKPSQIIFEFNRHYKEDAVKATDYYYNLSKNTNYIMTERVKKDISWVTPSAYGDLIVTVNLSKPEKDPRDVAAELSNEVNTSTQYPKCLLCRENEGYKGGSGHPGRANHRIIPLVLGTNEQHWYMQYSPYVYYNEHCIVFTQEHIPMKIDKSCFMALLNFVSKFPHYFIGSNSDLPIVGGSILTHQHFQGGRVDFPMALAKIKCPISFNSFYNIEAGILDWPLSTLRLRGEKYESLARLGEHILQQWREYSDPAHDILAYTDLTPHNTITPIARFNNCDNKFELDLILRNNRTTSQHPFGLFHAHEEYHHIKKEGIGLIEAMGLAVLPARLSKEYDLSDEKIRNEIGDIFAKILDNCGVFKNTHKGQLGFKDFIDKVNVR